MIDSTVIDELRLIADISERLIENDETHSVRPDQMRPLIVRLRAAALKLDECRSPRRQNERANGPEASVTNSFQFNKSVEAIHDCPVTLSVASEPPSASCNRLMKQSLAQLNARKNKCSAAGCVDKVGARVRTITKLSSVSVRAVPRESSPIDAKLVSKEVERAIACSLYNLLEGTTNLVHASSASIFIRSGDEMISIANVSRHLTFPPRILRHRCTNFAGATVLGSGIALNQRVNCGAQSSLLIFPVFPHHTSPQLRVKPLAVLSIENKMRGRAPFNTNDENVARVAASMIGELMSRVPQVQWVENFYDPITQHIVAPFTPSEQIELPTLKNIASCAANQHEEQPSYASTYHSADRKKSQLSFVMPSASLNEMSDGQRAAVQEKLTTLIDNFSPASLIRREVLPAAGAKSFPYGLTQTPSLREVAVYLENMQSCWKSSVAKISEIMEDDRNKHVELHHVRRELAGTRRQLNDKTEQLRLHELGTDDYKREYKAMMTEIDAFFHKK